MNQPYVNIMPNGISHSSKVMHISLSCQLLSMALLCCQEVPLHSELKITWYLCPLESRLPTLPSFQQLA